MSSRRHPSRRYCVRERAALREILRLVTERAEAEARWGEETASSNATADSEYQKARRALVEKLEKLEREARTDDEKRRRAIIDAAIEGEARAKAEFAAASRKIATVFDSARDTAKNDCNSAKTEAAATFDSARRRPPRSTPTRASRSTTAPGWPTRIRERLAFLAADYRKFKLNPEAPEADPRVVRQVRRSRRGAVHAAVPDGTPLKLLQGLIIPKAMKGRARGLGLHRLDPVAGRPGDRVTRASRSSSARPRWWARCSRSCSAPGWSSSPSLSSNACIHRSCSRWPTPMA